MQQGEYVAIANVDAKVLPPEAGSAEAEPFAVVIFAVVVAVVNVVVALLLFC